MFQQSAKCMLIVLACVGLAGCATVTRGTDEVLTIESTPAGAEVVVSTGFTCITPCAVGLARRRSYGIRVSKPGFRPQAIAVNSSLAPLGAAGLVGNIGLSVISLVGIPVDLVSGATRRLQPNPVKVELVPDDPAAPAAAYDTDLATRGEAAPVTIVPPDVPAEPP